MKISYALDGNFLFHPQKNIFNPFFKLGKKTLKTAELLLKKLTIQLYFYIIFIKFFIIMTHNSLNMVLKVE